jgi:hypothetical protein
VRATPQVELFPPARKPWEWCAECETDLRDYFHTEGCSSIQRAVDWDHEDALRYYCGGCGAKVVGDGSRKHRRDCPEVARWNALQAATAPARLIESCFMAPLHWPAACQLERPAFGAWLEKCHGWGYAHGAELVDALCDEGSVGSADGDQLLTVAMELAWVKRSGFSPTREQQRLGVGAAWGEYMAKYPCTYGYVPGFERRAAWGSCTGMTLGTSAPEDSDGV